MKKETKLLFFLYKTIIGRIILKLLTLKLVANLMSIFMNSRFSTYRINKFIKKHNIDMSIYENRKFKSYNDFFTRKMNVIPFSNNKKDLVSPSSCKMTVFKIDKNSVFKIKNSKYSVESILKNKKIAKQYKDGYFVVCRMSENDFHRYIYIDNGHHSKNTYINGVLHTVQPIAFDHFSVYTENSRSYTILETENFGEVIQIEVGAMMIGRITNFFNNHKFKKGEEKGMFEFGGSTVVLLIEHNRVNIREDILENSSKNIETEVFIGEKIGYSKWF